MDSIFCVESGFSLYFLPSNLFCWYSLIFLAMSDLNTKIIMSAIEISITIIGMRIIGVKEIEPILMPSAEACFKKRIDNNIENGTIAMSLGLMFIFSLLPPFLPLFVL